MTLFADRGFAATSITMIEGAAGLARGGGGVYKHFASKQAVLEAGIRRYEEQQGRLLSTDVRATDVALLDGLLLSARLGLGMLQSQRELIKVLFREMAPFPDLLAGLRERYIQATYAFFAAWLDELVTAGEVDAGVDTGAAAVVLVGAMVNYVVVETMLGEAPGPIPEERFVASWVDLAERALRPS